MNKYLIRVVTLLLVPCLVADPAMASSFTSPVPVTRSLYIGVFNAQAIVDPVIFENTSILSPEAPAAVRRTIEPSHEAIPRSQEPTYYPKTTVTADPDEPDRKSVV